MKKCCQPSRDRTHNLLITSRMHIQLSHPGRLFIMLFLFLTYWKIKFCLTFTTLRANSADDKLICFFIFPRKQDLIFHANCLHYIGDNFHELAKPVFWENKKNILICRLQKFYPECLAVSLCYGTYTALQTTMLPYEES